MTKQRLLSRPLGRCVGLDVHLDFIEIAICEEGKVFSAGRVPSTPEGITTLAESLLPTDRVALEVTGSSWEIVRLLESHVSKIVVVSPGDTGIARRARRPIGWTRARWRSCCGRVSSRRCGCHRSGSSRMRRRLARRQQLVRARSRVKNEIPTVLMRRLKGRPPVSDLFGVKGREWLRGLELPIEEDETVQAGLRHIEFLDAEIEQVERLISQEALESRQIRRLLTVPGVNVICAAVFLAAVGDIRRFNGSRPVVAYLGLDPRVYQSGSSKARSGRISKTGLAAGALGAGRATQSLVQQPGPLHAFYERIRARRGHNVAVVAVARKLAVLFWCMLTREEDYAHQQPSLTAQKLRRSRSKPASRPSRASPPGCSPPASGCARPRSSSPRRPRPPTSAPVADWKSGSPKKQTGGRERDSGARIIKALEGQSRAAGPRAPDTCTSTRHRLAPTTQPSAPPGRRPDDQPAPASMRATAGIQADGRRPHANPNLHHKHRNRKPALPKVCSHPLDFHRSSNSEAALDLLDRGEPSGELAPRRLSAACRSASLRRSDAATTPAHCRRSSVPGGSSRPACTSAPAGSLAAILQARRSGTGVALLKGPSGRAELTVNRL